MKDLRFSVINGALTITVRNATNGMHVAVKGSMQAMVYELPQICIYSMKTLVKNLNLYAISKRLVSLFVQHIA